MARVLPTDHSACKMGIQSLSAAQTGTALPGTTAANNQDQTVCLTHADQIHVQWLMVPPLLEADR